MSMSFTPMDGRPAWSPQVLWAAALLTFLMFALLPTVQLWNQPDVGKLIALRDVETIAVPPPPMVPLFETQPAPTPEPEPIRIELPAPAPAVPTPALPLPNLALPSFAGDFGALLGGMNWEIEPGVFTLGEIDTPPRPLAQVPPVYPLSARQSGIEGQVELEFVVTREGLVTEVLVISSQPGNVFVGAARAAVERWRFEPAQRGGEPVAVRVQVPLQFRLDR